MYQIATFKKNSLGAGIPPNPSGKFLNLNQKFLGPPMPNLGYAPDI